MTAMAMKVADIFSWASFGQWLKNVQQNLQKRRLQRETYNQLQSLSDAELQDIGIYRSDITAISNGIWDEKEDKTTTNDNLKGWV